MKKILSAGISALLILAFLFTGYRYVFPPTRSVSLEALPRQWMEARANAETTAAPKPSVTAAPSTTAAATTAPPATAATTATAAATAPSSTAAPSTAAATAASTAPTTAPTTTAASTAAPTTAPPAQSQRTLPQLTLPQLTLPAAAEKPPRKRTFQQAPEGYFNNALFIGDSRTEELMEYGNLPGATFFSRVGMSLYNMHKDTAKVNNGIGSVSFQTLINNYSFKKIYIMLGVNEIGYARQKTVDKFGALLEEIRAAQPDAIIFIEANIHLTAKESAKSSEVNNREIDDFNRKIAQFADGETTFYLDVNEIFDDENGNLRAECSGDGTHLKAKFTREWAEWLKTKAIVI